MRTRIVRFALALMLTAFALSSRMALDPHLKRELPYVTFFVAVVVTSSLAGPAPAILAAVLGCIAGKWFFIEPRHALGPHSSADWFRMVAFVGVSAVFVGMITSVSRARERSVRRQVELEHEVEQRKHTEAALRDSEDMLRLAKDAARMGAWNWNIVTGELVWTDRCKALFALPPDTAMSYEVFLSAVHPDDRQDVDRAVKDALAHRTDYDTEMRVPWPDGSVRWVSSHGRASYGGSGEPVRMAGMALDITTRKRAEEALRESDRRKSEFLGVLSHELRNPLASIRNSTYVLDHVPSDSPAAMGARRIIQRQTEQLARLVDDLLDVTRISRGKVELDRKQIDLRDVVLRTCEDHRSMFDEGQVELRHDLPVSPVWVDADAIRISQVLGNLLQNAVKFTPADGAVTVKVAARDGSAEMSVRDTGVGMRPEEVEHMFAPFAQAEQGLARTKGGLGLGLALSKGLVELHGGSLRARSDGPGLGSEFLVLLPLAPAPEISPAAPRTAEAAGGRLRLVLIIDDDPDTLDSLSVALRLTRHQVRTAHDGKTGIVTAHELRPDVVLCDIGLPDIDGYEVARTLRADETLRSTRLFALSGYARPEDKKRAKEAGFDAHLTKPFSIEEVISLLA
jgi:PAS domain S-box-containing protein